MPLDQSGACIILDPKTGAIKALVSRPSFDPSIFLSSISSQNWKDLTINNPFLNRAFNACYPPASIFKLVTASAALEQGLITPETTYNCKGFITFKGRRYYCSRRWGHGLLDIKESLAYSCNIMCYEIAKKISIDTLADYAFRFGLGEKTNIIFPEKEGIVPSNDWKMYTQGQRWWKGETLSAAIGQSFLLTTPLQVACMISALFEGYLVKPHILQTHDIETKPLRISQSTRQFLQECMESVITEGTGRNINRLKSVTVYAKTGTAQTSSKQNKKEDYSCHAWFVSYFYYNENNPQPLVMVVLIEKVSGSRAATNIAKKFLIDYIKCKEK
jgi:penicillin-binding protein 2